MGETKLYSESKKVVDLYGDGLSTVDIGVKVGLSEEEVLTKLREYKKSQFSKGQYSDELMILVASRDSSGAKRKDIMSDLKISRSFMVRAISEYGFLTKSKEDNEEHFFMNAPDGFEFTECPKCHSHRINDIQDGDGDIAPSGIYCMTCGNEFTLKDNIVKIVKWEYVD